MKCFICFFETFFFLLSRNAAYCSLSCRLNILSPKAELVTTAVVNVSVTHPGGKGPASGGTSVGWIWLRRIYIGVSLP